MVEDLRAVSVIRLPGLERNAQSATDLHRTASLLAITSQVPWPLNCGGHLRTYHVLKALARRFRVRLITTVVGEDQEGVDQLGRSGIQTLAVRLPPRGVGREALRALWAAVGGEPYVLYRRHHRHPVRAAIMREFRRERPDIVYLDHLDALVFKPIVDQAPMVIDLHNIYSKLVRRVAEESGGWLSRLYLQREARLLAQVERRAVASSAAVLAVSEDERLYFKALGAKAAHLVPNGVDCEAYGSWPVPRPVGPPTILFLGTMSWEPNVNAAQFLVHQVLPTVRRRYPQARLQIVGRDPTQNILALAKLPGVEVTGSVPDVGPYWQDAHLLAVPLQAGGGTRLKILEAFAAGVPVVSTPMGCEVIVGADERHLLVVPRHQFTEGILSVLSDRAMAESLARAARALAREVFDWSIVGRNAVVAVEAALAAT